MGGGSFNAVASLCRSGTDTLILDGSKNEPWQVAAEKGHESIVEKLLRLEGNLRDEHISNKQGLIFAAEMGYAGIARSLLDRNAEADTKDENGLTPLHWAMTRGEQELVELLLQKNWRTSINALDRNAQTPLCHGVLAGRAAVVKMLLRGTADPNMPDRDGRTALHHAALQQNWEMVRIWVDNEADIHARDGERKKAWQLAAKNGGHQVVSLLLGKEPDVRSLVPKLEEIFLDVVQGGRVPMVHLLLKNGVNINATDQYGSSAFGLAAECRNHEVVDLLLPEKADPGIAGWKGKTAILWATTFGETKIVSSILDNIWRDQNCQFDSRQYARFKVQDCKSYRPQGSNSAAGSLEQQT
jgi:ankyrin repeat protein